MKDQNRPHHEEHDHHDHHHDHDQNKHNEHKQGDSQSNFKLAGTATLHCLLGCGLGEVLGMVIGIGLMLDNITTIILAVVLGFVLGFVLGIRPLLKAEIPFRKAFRIVLMAEGLSILVMETAEVLIQVYTPGVMESGLADPIFWMGMLLALVAGFIAAFPVNLYLIGKGVSHQH